MLGQKKRRERLAFNAEILRTFGKLDQQDIDNIEGSSERLRTHLIQRYKWSLDEAASRVASFRAVLSTQPQINELPPDAGVRV